MWNASKVAVGLVAVIAAVGSVNAQTWFQRTGVIRNVVLSQANNFSFRVYIANAGTDQLSDCTNGFAYINTSDDNYQAKSAALMTAGVSKKPVTLSLVKDASNWCKIMDFAVDLSG